MELRTTPRSHERSRRLYEANAYDNTLIRSAIEIDTAIETIRSLVLSKDFSVSRDAMKQLDALVIDRLAFDALSSKQASGTITDYYRLASIASFSTERILAPVLFGITSEWSAENREKIANGVVGKSVELIDATFEHFGSTISNQDHDTRNNVIGAVNEATTLALLNFDESSSILALPSSAVDDIQSSTDAYLYVMSEGLGYVQSVSVKTNLSDARNERAARPNLVVVSASDFNNENLSISKLLVRLMQGSPGISDEEMGKLLAAKNKLHEKVFAQLRLKNPLVPCDEEQIRALFSDAA